MTTALRVYYCRVDHVDDETLEGYAALLDERELQRLAQFRVDGPRREYLLSRAMLRTVLAARLQTPPSHLRFARDVDGKPLLAPPFDHWHFNLSHSARWVALALAASGPVGIDIESHERRNDLAAIARRFFSAAENDALRRDVQDSPAWLERFFAIWTLKEAHAKALGCGLSKVLSCSGFVPSPDFPKPGAAGGCDPARIELQLSGRAAAAAPVAAWLYRLDPQTSLAVSRIGAADSTAPELQRWLPAVDGPGATGYFELAPIATGSWLPPVANSNPRA